MNITPMTELEAVNIILASIGESPVNSIENPTNVDVINAIRILRNNHKIYWSPHLLYIEAKDGTKYTKNGEYLYNFTEQTFNFLNPIEVQAIFFVDFDDMPDPMRNYICAKSAKTFQSRYLGDASLAEELERDEQEAWAALQEYELDRNDFSLLNFPAVSTITMRGN